MVDIQPISTKINMGIDILDSLNLAGVLFGFWHSTAPPIFLCSQYIIIGWIMS
jgi:hypothetical protein